MRIALVTHKFTHGDGQGRVNYEIAQAALRAGHQVWLVASEVAPELAAEPNARCVLLSVDGWPTRLVQNQVFALKSALWLARNRKRLDVVHVNGFITWGRADINTAHFVHSAWLQSPVHTWRLKRNGYEFYQFVFSKLNSWLERRAYRASSIVVAVSEQVRRELLSQGVPADTIRVISNGVNLEEFCPRPVERRALGLPEGLLLLFVGEIRTPRKNLDTLLQALRSIPEAVLCVVGDIAQSPYPELARRLGVSDRVIFLGFRRDVAELMRAVDLFVFPSRYEACSLVLLEALASGLPIVAARSTGGTELLTPECSVLIGDANSVSELSEALRTLAVDRDLRVSMSAAAASLARQHTWGRMAQRYLRMYEECGTGRSAPFEHGQEQPGRPT
jgi:glycosyltransferase involved in cell wall biosynthesis